MASILVVEGADLTKMNGGGVRSRVILSSLQELGDVHVISIARKARHMSRIDQVTGVASHARVLVNLGKWHDFKRLYLETLVGIPSKQSKARIENPVAREIDALVQSHPNIQLLTFRYFKAWALARMDGDPLLERQCVWLDFDDRTDKILRAKMKSSSSWLKRSLADRAYSTHKQSLERAASQSDLSSLASASDLVDFAPTAHVVELANVVPTPDPAQTLAPPSGSQNLIFIGAYDWLPNTAAVRWFIENCWSEISAKFPEAALHVIGTGKQSTRDALALKFDAFANIHWHHNVPDLNALYADCRMVISPVQQGSGSKIKVIEAAAFARPTVVTSHSARGLHPSMTKALKVAENAVQFSAHCIHYLEQPEQADQDGRTLCEAQRNFHSVRSYSKAVFSALQNTRKPPSFSRDVIEKFDLAPPQSKEVHS